MSFLLRWTCAFLIGVGGVAAAAAYQGSCETQANEVAERGADSLVSGSEQAVLEWALTLPADGAAKARHRG